MGSARKVWKTRKNGCTIQFTGRGIIRTSRPGKLYYSAVGAMLGVLCSPMYGYQSPDATGMWVTKGSMAAARSGACAASLPEGRVLSTGGQSTTGSMRATLESSRIYPITTRIARRLMATPRTGNTPASIAIAFDRKSLGNKELQFPKTRSFGLVAKDWRAVTYSI